MQAPTAAQRRALLLASRKGGAIISRRAEPDRHEVRTQIANAVIEIGWAIRHQRTLLITRAGRLALTIPTTDPPVFLHARDGLTTMRSSAAAGEAEVMDTATLSSFWTEQSLRQKAEAADRRAKARHLRVQAVAA